MMPHLERIHVIGLDRVQPHQVPRQAPGQTREGGTVLNRLSAVVNTDPLGKQKWQSSSG